ncbi:MAG: diaminopimelate decarboxylase [Candidatus Omnitrophota bacterium]
MVSPYFRYHHGELYCEGAPVRGIVQASGTPVFIYSRQALLDSFQSLRSAFRKIRPLICYSVKANSNLAVLRTLVKAGAGLDIVSGGELFRGQRAGCSSQKIVYAGVGKTEAEIREAIRAGILLFNVESVAEIERIEEISKTLRRRTRISLRLNPSVDPRTHRHIATGRSESKFGIDFGTARRIFQSAHHFPHLDLCGLHVHIGSQILWSEPFAEAFRKMIDFVDALARDGVRIRYLNLGGGLGVRYRNETPIRLADFARKVAVCVGRRKIRLILEPGRFISANAGILVTEIQYVKRTDVRNFLIVDAAMTELIRPSLYGAYHEILPVVLAGHHRAERFDVVGPVCESGDFFAKKRSLPIMSESELLAILSAGAYGFSMSSNYNSRPRAAEVLVSGKKTAVVRRRETKNDLVRGERIPKNF